jgi:hypothetical protein
MAIELSTVFSLLLFVVFIISPFFATELLVFIFTAVVAFSFVSH